MTQNVSRRRLLQAAIALPAGVLASPAIADEQLHKQQLVGVIDEFFGANREVLTGRVKVAVPAISENGYSVPLTVEVESPMTRDHYVQRILVVAAANPNPIIARFELGPRAGFAKVSTRIRLADTQRVYAIAETNDGRLWSGYGHSVVTLAACII